MTQNYGNQNAHDGDSIFEDVYIYGKLNYDFGGDSAFRDLEVDTLKVLKNSDFLGVATFRDDVFIEGTLDTQFAIVRQRLDVGFGGTALSIDVNRNFGPLNGGKVGVANTLPIHRFQVGGPNTAGSLMPGQGAETEATAFIVSSDGTVGIGTTDPLNFPSYSASHGPLKMVAAGSIKIDRNIYDSADSVGSNGYYLKRDGDGIRWAEASPIAMEGIYVQDEGVFLPTVGTAQTFSTLNFVQTNSLGLGTDTITPIPDPDNPTNIARIQSSDLWGYTSDLNDSPIYRMTKVGIKNQNPSKELDISGEVHATGDVDFDALLNVDGDVTFNAKLDVDGDTTLNATLDVDGATTLNNTLDVDGATTLNATLDVDGKATFNDATEATSPTATASVQIDGGVGIAKKLFVGSNTRIQSVEDSSAINSGALRVDGGAGIGKNLHVGGIGRINSNTTSTSVTSGALVVTGGTGIGENLWVGGYARVASTQGSTNKDTGSLVVEGGVGIEENVHIGGNTSSTTKDTGALVVEAGGLGVEENVNIGQQLKVNSDTASTNCTTGAAVVTGGVGIGGTVNICGDVKVNGETQSNDKDTGAVVVEGGVGIEKNLNVGQNTRLIGTLELENSIIDKLNSLGYDASRTKNDYRLSAVGSGVSWRPSGVDTDNAIWVTVDGDDTNTGLLEGDAKRTVGAAASIAKEGDTIIIRSGSYTENNPIGLRTDVSVSGEDLRLVTIIPQNRVKDVFHVRRGCLIQNINFSGPPTDGKGGVSYAHTGAGAVAFPPPSGSESAATGYLEPGPANEGATGRWKSPYIRNCTNFMTKSIGMKIDGDNANADFTGVNNLGQDLKSMVCDAFTQYNEAGVGVSITNNAYAQLVSIFTIASDIGISCSKGGQCDLTNSNSSFGNFGLVADGVGDTEFTGTTFKEAIADSDVFEITNCKDSLSRFRKPFDGQGLFFKINLANYNDTTATGTLTKPLQLIRGIRVVNGGNPGDYFQSAPPVITVPKPLGPEGIQAEFSANVSAAGTITSVDVIASGRNFLSNQSFTVNVSGTGAAQLEADTDPILYTVNLATEPTSVGLTTVTFDQFIPYEVPSGVDIELVRLSRIITSSHSFEYIGAGTDINKANPFQGGEPITANEVVAKNGGQVPFTSTDQKGKFRIGDGLTVDQTTSTIRGRDFNRAIQAQLTPLILALR